MTGTAAGCNRFTLPQHGLPRTNADKRRAVSVLLADPEWAKWSNREIARRCVVTHGLVNSIRSLDTVSSEKTYTTKHGTEATMATGRIGKRAGTVQDVTTTRDGAKRRRGA